MRWLRAFGAEPGMGGPWGVVELFAGLAMIVYAIIGQL
jgi:hypothetical protein